MRDPALLWLWCRLAATAPISPLAWEPPHTMGAALRRQKKKKKVGLGKDHRGSTAQTPPPYLPLNPVILLEKGCHPPFPSPVIGLPFPLNSCSTCLNYSSSSSPVLQMWANSQSSTFSTFPPIHSSSGT